MAKAKAIVKVKDGYIVFDIEVDIPKDQSEITACSVIEPGEKGVFHRDGSVSNHLYDEFDLIDRTPPGPLGEIK